MLTRSQAEDSGKFLLAKLGIKKTGVQGQHTTYSLWTTQGAPLLVSEMDSAKIPALWYTEKRRKL